MHQYDSMRQNQVINCGFVESRVFIWRICENMRESLCSVRTVWIKNITRLTDTSLFLLSVKVSVDWCEVAVVCLLPSVWDVWLDSARQSCTRRFPTTDRCVKAKSALVNPAVSPPTRRCQLPPDKLWKWNVSLVQFKRKHQFLKPFFFFMFVLLRVIKKFHWNFK